tara:strand:+ start:396 stop:1100 length:705 start_codon:yes stop_codon:yes gene_type:complete
MYNFNRFKFLLANNLFLYKLIFLILRFNDNRIVRKNTDLVIEGFPRSANTFCKAAFLMIDSHLSIASHIHLPINIKLGLKNKIPIIILIRKPIDAITSHIIRSSSNVSNAINSYKRFHINISYNDSRVLFVKFETIVKNFPIVITKYNELFDTNYNIDIDIKDFNKKVFKFVKTMDKIDNSSNMTNHKTVAIPNQKRIIQKNTLTNQINSEFFEMINDCNTIYKDILAKAKNII